MAGQPARGRQGMVGDPDRRAALAPAALEFVDASVAAGTVRERAERRRMRWLRGTVAVLAALVLAVAGLSTYTLSLRQQAVTAEHTAIVGGQEANARGRLRRRPDARHRPGGGRPARRGRVLVRPHPPGHGQPAGLRRHAVSGADRQLGRHRAVGERQPGPPAAPRRGRGRLAAAVERRRAREASRDRHAGAADADHPLYVATFSPDGSVIAAAGAGRVVHLWRVSGTESFFAGLELVGPGVTEAQTWRAWLPDPVLRRRDGHVLAGAGRITQGC